MEPPLQSTLKAGDSMATEGAPGRLGGVTMEFPAVSDNVGFARTVVAVFASRLDFTLDELDEIKVAVSEAVSNCVLHAYPDGGRIRMRMDVVEGRLHVTVEDDGVGIDDVAKARETGVTSRPDECMGLGFTFMEEYMDRVEVTSEPGRGTRVHLRKRPVGDGGAGAAEGEAASGRDRSGEHPDGLVS